MIFPAIACFTSLSCGPGDRDGTLAVAYFLGINFIAVVRLNGIPETSFLGSPKVGEKPYTMPVKSCKRASKICG